MKYKRKIIIKKKIWKNYIFIIIVADLNLSSNYKIYNLILVNYLMKVFLYFRNFLLSLFSRFRSLLNYITK